MRNPAQTSPANQSQCAPADQALRESEARTRAILDAAVDAIITIDERGAIESMNPATERMFGYSAAELVGKNVKMLMPPPFHDEHDGYLLNYLATGEKKIIGFGREVVGLRKDGTTFPMHLAVSELWLGNRRMFTGIARDITQAFGVLVDGVTDYAIYILDPQGRVASWNAGAQRIKGYRAAEIIGQHFSVFYSREAVAQGWPQHELEMAARQGRFEDEGWRIRKDGSQFWASVVITALRGGTGTLLGFSKITRDLTERKQAEEAVRSANVELENQVQRRTAELQQRNAELLRSNQELDDFAYIASHDLKEPLRGIHNYATFLIEDYGSQLDDAGRTKLETLQRLTTRMNTLLDSLLDTSRVGRMQFAIKDTDLNELLAEVLDSLRFGLQEQEIDVRIPEPLPILRCDRVRIGEVLRNLITNAMKYNDKPQKWIEIGVSSVAPPTAAAPRGRRSIPCRWP